MASKQLQDAWMQHGQYVGYEEGYKKSKKEGHLDIDIEAIHTTAFKEGHVLGAANEK